MANEIQQLVRQRAGQLCEYCHTSEQWQYVLFTVDHIIPVTKGGTDDEENLALACFHCNRRKSDLVAAIDPETGEIVSLYHPRQDTWQDHFVWSADKLRIVPLTAVGRATVHLLRFNRDRILAIRAEDVQVNRHPPPDDPIQQS